ncbi:hypothetical protein UXO11_22220 [Enterobacter wuhouensis]|uniref:hypothetical protein n=1 Tax=Enterobacter wuhouensis TaxID=2529381 RepID=UPI002FD45F64
MLEDKDQADVLRLFLDDNEKPSKNGRHILAISAAMLGMDTGRRKPELLSMDILMGCDKQEVREALDKITSILEEENAHCAEISMNSYW